MRKFLPRVILIALFASLLFGCVPSPAGSDGDGREIDMYESEFIIYQINGISQSGENPMLCTAGTDRADMVLKRISDIEELYNCVITFSYNEHTEGVKDLFAAAAISKHAADLIVSENIDNIYDLVYEGLLYDLLELNDTIGYDSSTFDIYGYPEYLEAYMYKGQLFAVAPLAHPGYQLHRGNFILADTEIVSEYTGLDLRELHEQQEWTWSILESVIDKCTVVEEGETKIYGGAFEKRGFIEHAIGSNGYSMVIKNVAGNYVMNDIKSNAVGALDWCNRLMTQHADSLIFEGRTERSERFVEGGAALINLSGRYVANDICYKKDNFALLPFPCGPMATYGEQNVTGSNFQGISIYKYCEEPDYVALVLQTYCQPFEEYPDAAALREYYKYMLWDERDIELIFDPVCSSLYNYTPMDGDVLFVEASERILSMSPAQIVESYLPMTEDICEEWMIPNAQLIEELYNS